MNRIQHLTSTLKRGMGPWLLGILAFAMVAGLGGGLAWAAPPNINPAGTYIEAENYTSMGAPAPWAWEVQNGVTGFTGSGYLFTLNGGTGTAPNGSRVDYPVNFTTGGTYYIWLRARDQAGTGGGDSTFWGIDGVVIGALTQSADNAWAWTTSLQNGGNSAAISAGNHTINLWPREAGQSTDGFLISTSANPLGLTNNSSVGIPGGATVVDPTGGGGAGTGGGGGAGTITIPDDQSVKNITAFPNQIKLVGVAVSNSNELRYTTAETGLTWRALGKQSDGFSSGLGSKWTKTDIGGDTTVVPSTGGGILTLTGSGQNIWGTTDTFSYLYQPNISGDFTIDVQVKGMTGTQAYAKAGIMVRQTLAANSVHATALLTKSNGAGFYRRATSGGSSTNTLNGSGDLSPRWVRISRVGNTFTAYYSTDAISWTTIGSQAITMADPVIVGLAVTSANASLDNAAQFDNFMFMPSGVTGMNTGWTAVGTNISTTGWADGTYGVAMRSSAAVAYDTNTFNYSSCADATPSNITIPASQTVKGSAVSLPALFSHSGNIGSFTYQINGATVANPWNSMLFGTGSPQVVSLKVSGVDPDCGGTTISATQNITVNNTCIDTTPSTITIPTGQGTGGPSVDLTKLYTTTGNVGSLTYTINGSPVTSPWSSLAYGASGAQSVTLEARGTDPDCGGYVILASNSIEINNTCVINPPSINFDKDLNYVGAGRAIPYVVTIRNEDSLNCPASVLTVSMLSDSNLGDFDPSYFSSGTGFTIAGDNKSATINLGGRVSATINLAVTAKAGAVEWNTNNTSVRVSSASGQNTKVATTGVFLVSPITHSSITTGSTKWGGNWGTSKAGSQYGNFDCLICHVKDGTNIKWMRSEIRLPGATWGTGTTVADLPIYFQDARDGSADWGNDDWNASDGYDPAPPGIGRSGSNRSCEVCHTRTMYHRYDTEADPDGAGPLTKQTVYDHFPNRDCTDCHRHSLGFTASCDGCHGNPPLTATLGGPSGLANIPATTGSTTPGTHYKHVTVLGFPCTYCHANYRTPGEMPKTAGNGKQDINHSFHVFNSAEPAATAGHYTGQDGVSYEGTIVPPGQGTMTCENIYCHGGTDNMGGSNPQWNGNITCNACHGTSATNTPPGYSHTTHVGKMGLACTLCHGASTGLGANGHVNGSVHIDLTGLSTKNSPNASYTGVGGTASGSPLGKLWDSGKLAPSASYGSCSNVACHYNRVTPPWNNNNQPATCTICHNNGTDNGLLVNAAPNTGKHAAHMDPARPLAPSFVNRCESCHGAGANTASHGGHINFTTNFAAGMSYTAPNCTIDCHGPSSLNNWTAGAELSCVACHEQPYLGPTVVDTDGVGGAANSMAATGYGSHLKGLKTDNLASLTPATWGGQCKKCHPLHSGGVTVPLPPTSWDNPGTAAVETYNMQERLGIQYTITQGIHLGGSATSGASEAQICWNCHDLAANGVSEWGVNQSANTGNLTYNYGSLNTSNWTTAIWTSGTGLFSYKSAAIASTHAVGMASGALGVQGKDPVANIRCSYCHDVHDMNRAIVSYDGSGNPVTESFTGKPYLRGSWRGNPYKEDGAPQQNTDYPNTNVYGGVPRGSNSTSQPMGGYWIDQNSANPTSSWSANQFGGICEMCHGDGDGNFTAAEIGSLNYFGAQGAGWVSGYNGHANSVKGGAGPGTGAESTARNIFDARSGSTNGYAGRQHYQGNSEPGDGGGGLRGDEDSFAKYPKVRNYNNEPKVSGTDNWAVDESGATTQANYHQFSCSKCHSPHASRLPALMLTNCLDTKHNTWDNGGARDPVTNTVMTQAQMQIGANSSSTTETRYGGGSGTIPSVLRGTTVSNWTTAQNCHRLGGNDPDHPDDAAGPGAGWNTVTPW